MVRALQRNRVAFRAAATLGGVEEKFSPDLCTGTGNFPGVASALAGSNGLQSQLSLCCRTGAGNGRRLQWAFSAPDINRGPGDGFLINQRRMRSATQLFGGNMTTLEGAWR